MKLNIKDFRQSHRLYQSDMAELLELNQSNISRAELRGYLELTYPQRQTLFEKFGKENVESFAIKDDITIDASNNENNGDGTQNNGYFEADVVSLGIIKKQSELLSKLAEKQSEQTDRLLEILNKLSEKL